MYRVLTLSLLALLMLVASPKAHAQELQKLAQTGMKFLSVSNDPRAAALGNSVTSIDGLTSALFYNPASMARQSNMLNVFAGYTEWIAGIEHQHATMTFSPLNGRYGVFGVTIQDVSYGEFQETVRWENEQGFRDIGTFSPSAYAFGIGYARAITDRFSVGGHVKYVSQDLGASAMGHDSNDDMFMRQDNQRSTVAYDFGVLYHTGFESLTLAMAIRNFSQEVQYEEESFQLPLNFHMGVSMDMIDLTNANPAMHSLLLSIDAQRPRDYSEMVTMGTEYTFMNTFMVRAGYAFLVEPDVREADQQGLSLGAGVRQNVGGIGFGADYAYTQFGVFSDVHRIALQLSF
jgi:hypothetical protein